LEPEPSLPIVSVHESWYGWQTLAVDGAALLMAVGGVSVSDGGQGNGGQAFAGLATATYALGGPIVHFAHAHVSSGFASLALRVFTPILFAFVGYGLQDCAGGQLCGLGGLVIGGGLGILTAITVDAAVLAREDVPDREVALLHLRLALVRGHGGLIAWGSF
jgi:hypothetical protein